MIYFSVHAPTKGVEIFIEESSIEIFKQLVHRATNLWPDAPAEIKEFADLIIHGKILQDYKSQDTSKSRSEEAMNILHHCAHEYSVSQDEFVLTYTCKRCGDIVTTSLVS